MEKKVIPIKELVPFEIFLEAFTRFMENQDRHYEEGDGWPPPAEKSEPPLP